METAIALSAPSDDSLSQDAHGTEQIEATDSGGIQNLHEDSGCNGMQLAALARSAGSYSTRWTLGLADLRVRVRPLTTTPFSSTISIDGPAEAT